MTEHLEQRSPEWFMARLGKPTASNAYKILSRTKSGAKTAEYENYMWQLIGERAHQAAEEIYVSKAMQRGTDLEPIAREIYKESFSVDVVECGLVLDESGLFGASPDGLVGDDGLIEIKVPDSSRRHLKVLDGEIDEKYLAQMCVQLVCTKRKWCDFVSYDDRMVGEFAKFSLLVYRYVPPQELLDLTKDQMLDFAQELDAECERLLNINKGAV